MSAVFLDETNGAGTVAGFDATLPVARARRRSDEHPWKIRYRRSI
jgi:hypothetical protein